MKKINYKDMEMQGNPHGVDARKLYLNEDIHVVHMHLKAHERLIKHSAPVNVLFYVLEGEGYVEIGDEKVAVSRDMLIESPKNIPHCLYNEGEGDFRVLVLKTPAPTADQNKQAIQGMLESK